MSNSISNEDSLRLKLLRRVALVVAGILIVNFVVGLIRHTTVPVLVAEALCVGCVFFSYFATRRGAYDLGAFSLVFSTFLFVVSVRLFSVYNGEYLLSQNALGLAIVFIIAAVFIRQKAWLYVVAAGVCTAYLGFVVSVYLAGYLGNNPIVPQVTAPLILLPAIVTLGLSVWTIFHKTSTELRSQVREIEKGHSELATLNTKLEEKVYERSMQLIEKSRHEVLDSMVAGLSHQLNTPLGSAMTVTSFIKSKLREHVNGPDEQRILDAVVLVERNLQRAIDLMASYRELGSFAGEDPTVYSTLGPFFSHVRNNVESLLQGQGVVVSYSYDEMLGLQIPMSHLHYVLIELVHNARIHADHEGQKIFIESFAENGRLQVNVFNTGSRVDESVRSKALDPFFTTAGNEGRLGIGLANIQTIVRDILRGTVTILEPRGEWAFGINISIPGAYRSMSGNSDSGQKERDRKVSKAAV